MANAEGLKVEIDARHIDEVKTRIAHLETERDALREKGVALWEALERASERASWIRRDRSYKAPEQLATQESEERLSCVLQEIGGLATDFSKPEKKKGCSSCGNDITQVSQAEPVNNCEGCIDGSKWVSRSEAVRRIGE